MKNLLKYMAKYRLAYVFGLLCIVISVSLDSLAPQVTRRIIDDVIKDGKIELLTRLLLLVLMIGVGRAFSQYFKEQTFDRIGLGISVRIRKDLLRHIQGLSINYFDKTNTGELMSRIKDDVDRVWGGAGYIGMLVIEVILHTTLVLYNMITLSVKLSIIPLVAMPVIAIIAIYMEKKLDKIYEQISEENAILNTIAQENLAGVRTVKSFAREKFEIKKFLSHNKKYNDLNMTQSRLFIRYQPLFQFVTKLLPIVALMFGGKMVVNGEMTIGALGAFVIYCDYIVWPMEILGWLSNDMASALASMKKINKIFDEKPMIKNGENPITLPEIKGHVNFNNVSLKIDDNQILSDISFDLPEGNTLGIMGATGTGKSSIINLLSRFYDASEGSVSLDGVDVRELSLKQLRSAIAPVMQDVFLFSDTINENVKLGKKHMIMEEEVLSSLEMAQAMEFVTNMEDGFDTLIGERGVGLSGGQKQRISIARAFSKKTPVLVMDDSTSALDMETEFSIQKELNELKGTTKIIIAHRISAVRHADEIIFLENGTIAERGTHVELLEKKGLYHDTFMAQYGEVICL